MMMLRDADLMSILRKLQEAEAVYMLFHSNQSNLQNQCNLNQIPKVILFFFKVGSFIINDLHYQRVPSCSKQLRRGGSSSLRYLISYYIIQCKSLKQEQSCHKDQQINQQKSRDPVNDASSMRELGSTVENV